LVVSGQFYENIHQRNLNMENKKGLYLSLVIGLATGALIAFFLSGKIIDIPHGTHEGGIIAATGYAIIVVSMFLVSFIVLKTAQFLKK